MKVKKVDWYGFEHDKVAQHFEGDLTFLNYFSVPAKGGGWVPVAVYKSKKPNIKKGHKKYMLLQKKEKGGVVAGMSAQQMTKYRTQDALHCLRCDTVIYSIDQHHYHSCPCGNISVDGGRDYLQFSFKEKSQYKGVLLDLLTDKIVKEKSK